MKIERFGTASVIMNNPGSIHNYFAWSSIVRLKNGQLAVAASGYRLGHVCPFGKAVMALSNDDGETFSRPAPIIDTCLDDRDAGLLAFGENGLILTSFTNTVAFQRSEALTHMNNDRTETRAAYVNAYLDLVTPEMEQAAYGTTFRVSFDNGTTFGDLYHAPVSSPHGPCALSDGTILWVGREYPKNNGHSKSILAYSIDVLTGESSFVGEITGFDEDGENLFPCEPYALQMPSGKLICHIRVQRGGENRIFTTYQSESPDFGKTWTKPHRIMGITEGAPSHLLLHSSGALICTYSHRDAQPLNSIKAIFSYDEGTTWSEPSVISEDAVWTRDHGYPTSVELSDGSVLTVFYAHPREDGPAEILKQKWSFKN